MWARNAFAATELSLSECEQLGDLLPRFTRLTALSLSRTPLSALTPYPTSIVPKLRSLVLDTDSIDSYDVLSNATSLTRLWLPFPKPQGGWLSRASLNFVLPSLLYLSVPVGYRSVATIDYLLLFLQRHPRISLLVLEMGRQRRPEYVSAQSVANAVAKEKEFKRALRELIDYADRVCMEHVVFRALLGGEAITMEAVKYGRQKQWTHVSIETPQI